MAISIDEIKPTEEIEAETIEEKPPEKSFSREDYDESERSRASGNGWKDLPDYIKDGGDPEKWRDASAFNLYGEMVGELKRTKSDFDARIEGIHKLSQAQIASERIRLMSERDQAIDDGKKEAVHALDKQIQSLNVPALPQTNSLLEEWNSRNQWIYDDSPKSSRAKDVFGRAVSSGKSLESAISEVEADIRKNFTTTKLTVPDTERGKGSAGFGRKAAVVTMSDLTDDEKLAYKALPGAWKSEKEFLQAVVDDRKAARGER